MSWIGEAKDSEVCFWPTTHVEYAEQGRIFTQSCNGILTFKFRHSQTLRIDVLA